MFQSMRVAAVIAVLSASISPAGAQELAIELQQVASGLTSPVDVTHAGDGSGRVFIVQQSGEIRILEGGSVLPTPFLDISDLVDCCAEGGLLGVAFHPDYTANGFFYVNYTEDPSGDTVIARYQVSATDPDVADPDSAQLVLTFDQPFLNHNGGQVRFGPDGYLYISTGDGGGAGDPQDNGQDLETLLGKLLRIDVDGDEFPTDPNRNYAIPPDNPFVGVAGLDEIWAYGLRNPWRFSFDRAAGDLWIGDVGQLTWEEIDLQPAASAGGENYGWDVLEGGLQPGSPGPNHPNCFEDVPAGACADLLTGGSSLPVLEYSHSLGCSVTGGYRYRGEAEGQLRGVYFYADYCSGRIWGTLPRCEQGWASRQLLDLSFNIATFGEDEAGEVYVARHSGSGQGTLHRITVAEGSGGPVLTPDPGTIDFGSTGGTVEVVLQHTGTGADAVVIGALELSDTASFSVDPNGGANPCGPAPICLPPGASCTITVTFDPQAPGTYDELLTFGANSPPAAVTLIADVPGEGEPELEIAPASLNFGEVPVGETGGPLGLTLTSSGTADVTVDAVTGPQPPFAVAGGTCGPAPFTLAPAASCTLDYSFSPTAPGPAASAVTVASDAPSSPQTIPLEGVGTGAGQGASAMALVVDPEAGFSDGNGVFEPGELIDVAPAWRNDDVAPQSLTGAASAFTGPPGAGYSLVDGAADYGLVDPGATASCLDLDDCYRMGLNTPEPRPATHWDTSFDEALSDGASGRVWTLHIGDSFTDVPRESLFYSWIETLLHRGVTGGCTATDYCPTGPNTRAQMAVFLLKASAGGDYVPPACAGVFNDVPCPSLFADWTEDLAVRGVTAGCGGGNYCPNNSVSRDQMAVFLLKALEGSGYTPPACTGVFADVPCPSLFADWVEDLVTRQITAGCGGGNYCPANQVSRDQMAVFLAKTFGLVLYGP